LHGYGLDVAMGYFLLPLVMVVAGRLFYGERLSLFQKAAVLLAALGVAHALIRVSAFSWATAVVRFGYPPYFMLRRELRMDAVGGPWFDLVLSTRIGLWLRSRQEVSVWAQFRGRPASWAMGPMLGAISSPALVFYPAASRRLPLGLFGILTYVEPVLLCW